MNFMKKHRNSLLLFLVPLLLTWGILSAVVPKASPVFSKSQTQPKNNENEKDSLTIVALGDSLTEGVGDTTHSGGYVSLLRQTLSEASKIDAISTENFGKSGDRTDQLLKRLQKSEEMQKQVAKADIITITIGANDLLKVIRKEITQNITLDTFKQPKQKYRKLLKQLYAEIRLLNPKAPIYQMGIYNPFYLNFQELASMQEIVNGWNDTTETIVNEESLIYFVPINEQLSKGLNGNQAIGEEEASREEDGEGVPDQGEMPAGPMNNLLSDMDNFHPNNLGYQIMANTFTEKIMATKNKWIVK